MLPKAFLSSLKRVDNIAMEITVTDAAGVPSAF